jgi:hypothetical protein
LIAFPLKVDDEIDKLWLWALLLPADPVLPPELKLMEKLQGDAALAALELVPFEWL